MAAKKKHDNRCALSADPMPVNGECWCDLLDSHKSQKHDPLCPERDGQPCQCELIAAVEERVFESWNADLNHQRYH